VKKATSHKGKQADVYMIARTLEKPKGPTFAYAALIAQPYQQ